VRTENAIDISQTLAITIDQFYSIQKNFYLKVAYLLGIEPERFRSAAAPAMRRTAPNGTARFGNRYRSALQAGAIGGCEWVAEGAPPWPPGPGAGWSRLCQAAPS
jgi:hypothetical protein